MKVTFKKDGDQWCATRENFIDLQESIAGFGDCQLSALQDLILGEWTDRWEDDTTCGGYWEGEIKPNLKKSLNEIKEFLMTE